MELPLVLYKLGEMNNYLKAADEGFIWSMEHTTVGVRHRWVYHVAVQPNTTNSRVCHMFPKEHEARRSRR